MRIASILLAQLVFAGLALRSHAEAPKLDGKALYASTCAMCHGADGVAKPMGKGSSNFNDPAFALTTDEIAKVTLEGKNKMPKYAGKLKPEEVTAIAAHIQTLAPKK